MPIDTPVFFCIFVVKDSNVADLRAAGALSGHSPRICDGCRWLAAGIRQFESAQQLQIETVHPIGWAVFFSEVCPVWQVMPWLTPISLYFFMAAFEFLHRSRLAIIRLIW